MFNTLPTPSLLLDLDATNRNANRILTIAEREGVRLRPHVKSHKSPEIARLQLGGDVGPICLSTLAELRGFAEAGFRDFTYGVPIEPYKMAEVVALTQRGLTINVITDDAAMPALLNDAARQGDVILNVFLKVDSGLHRCGVAPSSAEAVEIPRMIVESDHLHFAGILTHAGQSYAATSRDEIAAIAGQERDCMVDLAERLRGAGIAVPTVSIGSTPTICHVDHLEGIDEIRPGNYIFFDLMQVALGHCDLADCAISVLATVVHRNRAQGHIVVDAGALALSKDAGLPHLGAMGGYGLVLTLDGKDTGLRVDALSQEHGKITVEDAELIEQYPVGTRLRIAVNHSCHTAAQHKSYHLLQAGAIVGEWGMVKGW